jgi:hypothetical protein
MFRRLNAPLAAASIASAKRTNVATGTAEPPVSQTSSQLLQDTGLKAAERNHKPLVGTRPYVPIRQGETISPGASEADQLKEHNVRSGKMSTGNVS